MRERRPGAVPDDDNVAGADGAGPGDRDVGRGVDTDRDGLPDTLVDADGADLLVLTDLDGDALADRVLRIGPDGAVRIGHLDGAAHVGHLDGAVRVGRRDEPGYPGPPWWEGVLGGPGAEDTT